MKFIITNKDFTREDTFEAKAVYPYLPITIDWIDVRQDWGDNFLCVWVKLNQTSGYRVECIGKGIFIKEKEEVNDDNR